MWPRQELRIDRVKMGGTDIESGGEEVRESFTVLRKNSSRKSVDLAGTPPRKTRTLLASSPLPSPIT